MPAITITDLNNAKTDTDHIAALATSSALTAVDRLGRTKKTMEGALAVISTITNRGAWATGTAYSAANKDIVLQAGTWYICVVSHTASASFSTDEASKWRVYQGLTGPDLSGTDGASKIGTVTGEDLEERLSRTPRFVTAIATLVASTFGIVAGDVVTAKGRSAALDGGGGEFYVATSAQAADGGLVYDLGGGLKAFRKGWSVVGFNGDVDPRWFGAKVDGSTDDSTAVNTTIAASAALGLSGEVKFHGGTWKLNNGIAHNSKVEVNLAGALLDFSGCTDFAAWSINAGKEIRQSKTVLRGGVMKGVSSPADGVKSSTTVGVQFNTSQVVIEGVCAQSFVSAWYFNSNAYVIALYDCNSWYNGRGWDADQTLKSNMGADLKAFNCLFAHNDYDVYNNLCESLFFGCAFDNCQKGYVEDNITASGGANNGYLNFQSCRWEAGGDASIPWFKNSGYMILKEPKFYEPGTYNYLFDNSGRIDIEGGLAREGVSGNYSSRNTGSGTINVFGCRPVDFNGECFRLSAKESGFHNSDFELGTTAGWIVATGSAANLTCVTTTPHLGTYCLQMVSGGATFLAETWPVLLKAGCKQALVNVYMKNLNATDVGPEIRFYTLSGVLITSSQEILPANTSAWTRVRFIGDVPAGAAYFKIAVPMASGQTAAVRLDDIYANFA